MKKKIEILFPGYSKLMAYISARIWMFPSQFSSKMPPLSKYESCLCRIKTHGSEKVEQIFPSCPLAMIAESYDQGLRK